jgi:hypothetical protein
MTGLPRHTPYGRLPLSEIDEVQGFVNDARQDEKIFLLYMQQCRLAE